MAAAVSIGNRSRSKGSHPAARPPRLGQASSLDQIRADHGDWLEAGWAPDARKGGREVAVKLAPLIELVDLLLPPQAIPVLVAFKAIALAAAAAGLDDIRAMLPPDRSAGVRFLSFWYRCAP
jgi:hypothetical protein